MIIATRIATSAVTGGKQHFSGITPIAVGVDILPFVLFRTDLQRSQVRIFGILVAESRDVKLITAFVGHVYFSSFNGRFVSHL